MREQIIVILLHFFSILLGIGALFVISRKISFAPTKIQNSFLLQALFYNIGVVFSALMDFMYYIFWDIIITHDFLRAIHRTASVLYLAAFALWALYYSKMIYTFLDIPIESNQRKYKIGIKIFIFIFAAMFIHRISGIMPKIYLSLYFLISFASMFIVMNYSMFLLRKIKEIADKEKRTALTVLPVLMLLYSLFALLVLLGNFREFWFILRTDMLVPILLDLVFNIFVIFWAFKYMDSLNRKEEPIPVSKESIEKIAEKYQISKRELEIIQLVCQGKSNQEIADALFVSLGTVKSHLYNVYNKIGIKNRIQLTKLF